MIFAIVFLSVCPARASPSAKPLPPPPYVINNTAQWVLFVNKINANDPAFNSKFFVLGSDLDFNNNSINPVGNSSSGFSGTLFGNKHTFKRARVNATSNGGAGFFYSLNGASVYDLIIDSSCTFSFALNKNSIIGTLSAYATNTILCNVVSYANITVNNSADTTGQLDTNTGGLIGCTSAGYIRIYKSLYKGNLTITAGNGKPVNSSGTAVNYKDNGTLIGGLIGAKAATNSEITIAQTYVQPNIVAHNGGLCLGGVVGGGTMGTCLLKWSDLVVLSNYTYDGQTYSIDIRNLISYTGVGTISSGSFAKNIYYYNPASTSAYLIDNGNNDAFTSSQYSGIVTNKTLTNCTAALGNTTVVSTINEVVAKANANTNITNIFNINSAGSTATSKLNATGNISSPQHFFCRGTRGEL